MRHLVPWLVLAGLLAAMPACGGGSTPKTPVAAAEHALTVASRGDKVAFAKTLASGPRGQSTADVQLEILSEWLWLRSAGPLALEAAELEGWEALRLTASTSSTATVATVVRFRRTGEQPPEHPVPVEIDLVREGGDWRIADARMTPIPTWYRTTHEEPIDPFAPGSPTKLPKPPSLAEIAATFRPPPPDWKR